MSRSEEKFLQQIEGGMVPFVARRLLYWAIRTAIGCGLTWLLVRYYPNLAWVWYITLGVAGFSLLFTLVLGAVLIRKGDRIREVLLESQREDDDLGDDHWVDDDDDWQESEDAEVIDDGWTEPADEENRR